MSIHGISTSLPNPAQDSRKTANAEGGDFGSLLRAYTDQMNAEHRAASQAAETLVTGKGGNTSEALLAIQKADLSFQLMLSVRNKLVDAYREVMRMQL